MKFISQTEVVEQLVQVIQIYNENRPHESLDMNTPEYAHNLCGSLKKHWKNYYKIKTEKKQIINSFIELNKTQDHEYPLSTF